MGYIYKITNLINQKSYIGKTEKDDPYKRWEEHQRQANRTSTEKRPLYSALNKYGFENFSFEILEETNNLVKREVYWIDFFNTYKIGYNATLGGDGKSYINTEEILKLYKQGYSCNQIAKMVHHHSDSISQVLSRNGVIIRIGYGNKIVLQYSKDDIFIQEFGSITIAEEWCKDNKLTTSRPHISEVCTGKRKTACGFIWKYKTLA